MTLGRIRVFRSATRKSNIAHIISDDDGMTVTATCGLHFDSTYETNTDHQTRLCIQCMQRKDRRDCDKPAARDSDSGR